MNQEQHDSAAGSGFSGEWEQKYRDRTHLSVWPWSDVVAYANRYARPASRYPSVLELGCGAGANIPFFLDRGSDYHAIEGSQTIVDSVRAAFPGIADRIVCGDFTAGIPFDRTFDVVLDRGSITHNDIAAIRRCLGDVHASLRRGGLLIAIDWLSAEHSDAGKGTRVDSHTYRDIDTKTFRGIGKAHFADKAHLLALLGDAGFEVKVLERKVNQMLLPDEGLTRGMFNFVAEKP